jgi:uncharacterized protein YnzC (UPF0291/DUF896 family)
MSKRADLKEWTVCKCHNQPIKRVNLPSHEKREKRHIRKQGYFEKRKVRKWFKTIERLQAQGHKIDADKLPDMTDDYADFPSFAEVIKS